MKDTFRSPAKINLRLDIVGRDETTGYHFLEMVLAPVSLSDEITVEDADRTTIITEGCAERIPSEKNIVHRVIRAVEEAVGAPLPPLKVTIRKNIPTGAGMGGGSGNGAAMLEYLDRRFTLHLGPERLMTIGARIGSDIPFFLARSPAVVTGFGEKVAPVRLTAFPFPTLVVHPGFPVDTRQAYGLWDKKMLTKRGPVDTNIARVSVLRSLTEWVDFIRNDLEAPVLEAYPALQVVRRRLTEEGAARVFMTGSGSAMVALFADDTACGAAERCLAGEYPFVRKVKVLT
ncbi:MAG TPA: 4-(cytidine 5'-diphospho)-2-C-methyl-D-erythritol kinase [bacterium]|nr:4-(cytidine 5'-diphospho)-2-C-methyl-D-erythritol kinase [bacterium]